MKAGIYKRTRESFAQAKSTLAVNKNVMGARQKFSFQLEIAAYNRKILIFLTVIAALMECFNMVWLTCFSGKGLSSPRNQLYFFLYTILLAGALVAALIAARTRPSGEKGIRRISWLVYLGCTGFCLWGVAVTVLDLQKNNNIIVYTLSMLTLAVFICLTTRQSCIAFLGSLLVFLTACWVIKPKEIRMGSFINLIIVCIMCVCISRVRYASRYQNFYKQQIILAQNREIVEMNDKLQQMVITDPLTGLYNRRFLQEDITRLHTDNKDTAKNIAVIMMDLDNFKKYNDSYGHRAGDTCIKLFAELLLSAIKEIDGYAVRYGGEEFLLVIFNASRQQAEKIAWEIVKQTEKICVSSGQECAGFTVSAGVCLASAETNSLEQLTEQADKALYLAKQKGKNRVCLYQG